MKIPVFLPVTREFGLRDEFAQDCLLQRRICEISVPPENPVVKAQRRKLGFTGIFAHKQSVRVSAIRSDRAAIEFRGFPPATATSFLPSSAAHYQPGSKKEVSTARFIKSIKKAPTSGTTTKAWGAGR